MSTDNIIDNTVLNQTKSRILTPEGTPEPEIGPPTTNSSISTKQVQVIDGDQTFNKDLQIYFNNDWKISNVGFDYNVVAVFGSQSTGKSTLLNNLFGTTFTTMSDARRQQTTKGLWMSMAQNSHTLIMDVEGTDGRERGEDQDFERKSALFSLAISQVLIVNLWESQVGLYNGANMGLLKTVFEVNLELFQQKGKSKTLLFFVIRDHLGNVPLNELSQTIKEDLEKIWSELSKPSGLEKCSITDFFDFMFFGLPHKVLMAKDFEEQAKILAKMFYDKDHNNFVFRPQYHKMIPADGFTHFVESIWEQIITNKNLDLPTQQQLLAQFRCDEISSEIIKILIEKFLPYKSSIESGKIIPDLGQVFLQNVDIALSRFDSDAGRYNKDVYNKKRLELVSRIYDVLSQYFIGQLRNIHRQNITSFPKRLDTALKEHKGKFNESSEAAKKETIESFKKGATEIILEGSEWTFVQELNQLDQELENLVITRREQELNKSNSELEKCINVQLADSIPELLQDPQPTLWTRVLKVFSEINDNIEDLVDTQAKNFGFSDEETTLQLTDTRVKLWNLLIRKIKEELQDNLMLVKLRTRLEESFRYDQDGLPKVWKPEDDIDTHFKKARTESLKLIPLLSTIDISSELDNFSDLFAESTEPLDFKRSLKIFSETKQKEFENKLKRESDALYLEAKRSIVSTTEKIPLWALAIMLALGWNEIYVVLTNPLYFIFLTVISILMFIAYRMNLLRPIITVVNVASQEGYRQLHDLLSRHFHPDNATHTASIPVEAIPMKDFGLKRASTTASEMTLVDSADTEKFSSEKSKLN